MSSSTPSGSRSTSTAPAGTVGRASTPRTRRAASPHTPEDGGAAIVVTCQDERSQLKNKAKAEKVLMARLLDRQMAQQQEALTEVRRSAVGSGDRSEKVRTYNYPEGRITDHRIDFKYYKLPQFVEAGDLDPVIDRLIAWDRGNRLSEPPNGAARN